MLTARLPRASKQGSCFRAVPGARRGAWPEAWPGSGRGTRGAPRARSVDNDAINGHQTAGLLCHVTSAEIVELSHVTVRSSSPSCRPPTPWTWLETGITLIQTLGLSALLQVVSRRLIPRDDDKALLATQSARRREQSGNNASRVGGKRGENGARDGFICHPRLHLNTSRITLPPPFFSREAAASLLYSTHH